ncbi:MAG TPA: AMP-binding protein [Microlunatus sp.]
MSASKQISPPTPPRLASYASATSSVPLLGDTIGANLDRTLDRVGRDHEALVECASGRRFTYGELVAEVDACALGLDGLGVRKGDRVGIWAPNCAEWVLVQYATAKLGAILVNINPAYRHHELAYVLQQAGISLLVSAPDFQTSDCRALVAEVRVECPQLRDVIFLGDPAWESLLAVGRSTDPGVLVDKSRHLSADDPINIQYTSGTTGVPKGATLTHHNLLNNGFSVGEGCGYAETDRVCIPVPFYHCFGMGMGILGCTSHGATMIIPAPGFDPALTLRAVQDERCTSLYGVPTMFMAELALPDLADYDLTSLRTGIMAGSRCPVEVMQRVVAEMGMAEVTIAYGMTETSPVSTQTSTDDDLERRTSTVGRVRPHLEVKIVDPGTGLTVPRGEPGEFCTRGYSVMLGYWNEPERTAEVIDGARWMHTGDLAVMDDDGYLSIVGRIEDVVIRGGQTIDPREVEDVLLEHADVVDVRVIGVPDERFGEEVMAWLRLRPGADALTAASLRVFCRGRVAHYKIPRYVKIVDDFPMTVVGTIRKVQLRAVAVTELGLERAAGLGHP